MRLGIVDLGTNSVRFDIQEIRPKKNASRILFREKMMIRLGEGVFTTGKLSPQAIQRAVHAFQRFDRIAKSYHVTRIVAFGTSALRDATDSESFVRKIESRTGVSIRIISAKEEAQLIAKGVLSNEKLPKGTFALVDIGGGSTEISICRGGKTLRSESFPLGTARLQQLFLKESPPAAEDIESLRAHIRSVLSQVMMAEHWPKAPRIIGSSGTIRALRRIFKERHGKVEIDRKDLKNLVQELSKMDLKSLGQVPGLEPKRVDMILAGAILFEEVMQALGAKKAKKTEYALRDGVLEEERELIKARQASFLSLRVDALYPIAERFRVSKKHAEASVKAALAIFNRLAPKQKLDPSLALHLKAAAILRHTGKVLSPSHFEMHSSYIVSNIEFPTAERWEQEYIAALCLFQRATQRGGLNEAVKGFPMPAKKAFPKLVAILSLLDAMEADFKESVHVTQVRADRGKLVIRAKKKRISGLEQVQLDGRQAFLERLLGKALDVKVS